MASATRRAWLVLSLSALLGAGLSASTGGCGLILGIHDIPEQGGGGSGPCASDPDCDDQNPCTADTCSAGACSAKALPDGPAAAQTPFDCRKITCQGGQSVSTNDDADVPDDHNDCTADACDQGVPSHLAKADETPCLMGGAHGLCFAGTCQVDCKLPSECDDKNPCTTDACDLSTSQCVFTPLDGVATPGIVQVPGDCKKQACVNGVDTSTPDDLDLPVTATDCDDEQCDNGAPSNPPHVKDSGCGTDGGKVCDGAGKCVQCNDAAQCGAADDCKTPVCTAGVCSVNDAPANTPVSVAMGQKPGDCHSIVCDGAGGVLPASIVDDNDVPADGNDCTGDVCMGGVPSNPDLAPGSPCGVGGLQACAAGGQCGCANDGQCVMPNTCGGGNPGSPFVCGCTPKTCAQVNATCGTVTDGCFSNQSCNDSQKNGAETDIDCGGGGACASKCALGKICGADTDCASGHCVDGVCCNAACNATCFACNLPGNVGSCSVIPLNATDANPVCSGVNACNGVGGCKKVNGQSCAAGSECLSAQCVDGVCCNTACSGTCLACNQPGSVGVCSNLPLNQPDASPVCSGTSLCDGNGACKKINGQACVASNQCVSGQCVDGYCCNSACGGTCQACNVAGSLGACTSIPSGQTDNFPVNSCNGTNACDGMGNCKKNNGQACGSNSECVSGSCADGVCCNSGCTGVCLSCNVGMAGTCSPVVFADDPGTCSGPFTCSGTGACLLQIGQSCSFNSDCAGNNCSGNICQ